MHRLSTFGAGILALACVVGLWSSVAADTESSEFVNRAWVDHLPEHGKEVVSWFVPMQMRGKRFGVAQRSSLFWYAGERFSWTRQGNRMQLTFQQSDRRVELTTKAYRCNKPGFDLCLDLERDGRKATLYSRKEWKVPQQGAKHLPTFDLTPVDATCTTCADALPVPLVELFGD